MPFIRLETTEHLADDAKARLCAELSRACAEGIGKPEAYVMAAVVTGATMMHGGSAGPAAFLEVRSIGGLSPARNEALSKSLCALVTRATKVPGAGIYLNFVDVAATHWGHDSSTFG